MDIEPLERMIARGQDSPMLRLTLGNAYRQRGDLARAAEHLGEAVRLDPDYSAAWKTLGRVLDADGRSEEALQTFRRGLEVAERKGDMQVVKELRVFIRRLERRSG